MATTVAAMKISRIASGPSHAPTAANSFTSPPPRRRNAVTGCAKVDEALSEPRYCQRSRKPVGNAPAAQVDDYRPDEQGEHRHQRQQSVGQRAHRRITSRARAWI